MCMHTFLTSLDLCCRGVAFRVSSTTLCVAVFLVGSSSPTFQGHEFKYRQVFNSSQYSAIFIVSMVIWADVAPFQNIHLDPPGSTWIHLARCPKSGDPRRCWSSCRACLARRVARSVEATSGRFVAVVLKFPKESRHLQVSLVSIPL